MSSKEKICPLMSVGRFSAAPCAGENCAWWDRRTDMCYIAIGADCARDIPNHLNALNIILEGNQADDASEQEQA